MKMITNENIYMYIYIYKKNKSVIYLAEDWKKTEKKKKELSPAEGSYKAPWRRREKKN